MSAYEPLFRHLLYPAYETVLRRRDTLRYLREYERSQWLAPGEVEALQWRKLRALLDHCWTSVPYYRKRWRALGIADVRDIRTPADYARLPPLTKPEIRSHFEELVSPEHRARLLYKTTGGSTGEPLRFGYTRESYERRIAIMHRGYGWAGARLGQRTLYLWGLPEQQTRKDRLYHAAFNRRMLNAFQMREDRMQAYADAFEAFRPETVVSYVAPILRLAEWLRANGRTLPPPQRILTAAEALYPSQRAILEEAFGCRTFNTYGCREFMLIASECMHGRLHTTADHLMVELGRPLDGDEAGTRELLVTDLHNFGMPLLRYANGDLATPDSDACPCGLGLPTLRSVDGRKLDALRTVDGRLVPGEFVVYAFLCAKGVRRYQAVQTAIDRVVVNIVADEDIDRDSVDQAAAMLRKTLGDATTLDVEYTQDIPLTPSGKHRVTINALAQAGVA